MTARYIRQPSILRLTNPSRSIYRAGNRYVVRPYVPGEGLHYLGRCQTMTEAKQRRDSFLREKGLK